MLGVADEYTAYCLDEAGAWLLRQKQPPNYGEGQPHEMQDINNKEVLEALVRAGGAKLYTK